MQRIHVKVPAGSHQYQIRIGRGILAELGSEIKSCLHHQARRFVVISNRKVFDLYGEQALQSLCKESVVSRWLMGDGERFKTLGSVDKALDFLSQAGLERTDVVVALGGGVVGDVAGFAAATYLRGIPFIQVPTTLVAQIDSSVGGKTGVNLRQGKNLVGAFHQPHGVIVDIKTLTTLPRRELTGGWCESIKQGAVGNQSLFKRTRDFLESIDRNRTVLSSAEMEKLVAAHCTFKASIVRGDERELPNRVDHRSRRILNFGHTIGHALEAVTRYRHFKHGEAVGHGMLVAGEISKSLGLLAASELESLREAVRLCGPLPKADHLRESEIMSAVTRDKKKVEGNVKWVLLERIGRARIVSGQEIPAPLLRASIRQGLKPS